MSECKPLVRDLAPAAPELVDGSASGAARSWWSPSPPTADRPPRTSWFSSWWTSLTEEDEVTEDEEVTEDPISEAGSYTLPLFGSTLALSVA
jgi:hypothetical protein